jgi:hypothetical protein
VNQPQRVGDFVRIAEHIVIGRDDLRLWAAGANLKHEISDVIADKNQGGDEFDNGIPHGYRLFAEPAFSPQFDPSKDGNVVVPLQKIIALWAM